MTAEGSTEGFLYPNPQAELGSRKPGMLDQDYINAALEDARTVAVHEADRQLPVLVPMEYGMGAGYDAARCARLLGKESDESKGLWYFTASRPFTDEERALIADKLEKEEAYVFFDHPEGDEVMADELRRVAERAGLQAEEKVLIDEEAEGETQQTSLALYGADVPADRVGRPNVGLHDLYNLYRAGAEAGEYSNDRTDGPVLFMGSELNDEMAEKFWTLYENRFQWLGESHPLSMEDTKESFLGLIRSPDVLCSTYFKDGEPQCFTYLLSHPDQVPWMNEEFLNDNKRMHKIEGQTLLFFPGIVSSFEGGGLANQVIGLITKVVEKSGGTFKVVFENTNRSEAYIPQIVKGAVDLAADDLEISFPVALDRQVYRCMRFTKPEASAHTSSENISA